MQRIAALTHLYLRIEVHNGQRRTDTQGKNFAGSVTPDACGFVHRFVSIQIQSVFWIMPKGMPLDSMFAGRSNRIVFAWHTLDIFRLGQLLVDLDRR